jgi:peroxiredoxin
MPVIGRTAAARIFSDPVDAPADGDVLIGCSQPERDVIVDLSPREARSITRSLEGGLHMRSDMVPGAVFPDYELSDHTAKHRKLSELQGEDPMVVVLSRGAFCPKDRRQAEGLLQLHREMEVGYCRLVTISTDNITQTNENRSGIGAHWPFLSDPRRLVQKDLDIAEYTDPVHNPMIPHVIVLEPGLVIHKIYNGYWFFGRPTMEELRQDLRAVSRKCRPDWDITTPELKAAWQQGRKELFYPYGKAYAETLGEQD